MSNSGAHLTYVDRPQPEPYIMAPRDMIEFDKTKPLSMTARVVRIYLHDLSRRPGWKIYVAHVQRALGLSAGAWARGRKELEAAGYYRAERLQDPSTGKWVWQHFVYRDPIAPSASDDADHANQSIPPKSTDGASSSGMRGDIRTNTQSLTTKRSSKMYARATVAAAAASDQHGYEPQKKKRRERPSGIVGWYPCDHDDAQEIESAFPLDEIAAAAEAISVTGKDPVPGLVKKELQRVRKFREKAVRAKAREESGPLAEALRRRAERVRREADPVARQAGLEAARKAAEALKI